MSVTVLWSPDAALRSFEVAQVAAGRQVKQISNPTLMVGSQLIPEEATVWTMKLPGSTAALEETLNCFDYSSPDDELLLLSQTKPKAALQKVLASHSVSVRELKRPDLRRMCPTISSKLEGQLIDYAGDDSTVILSFIHAYGSYKDISRLTFDKAMERLSSDPGKVAVWSFVSSVGDVDAEEFVSRYRRWAASERPSVFLVKMLSRELSRLYRISLLSDTPDEVAMPVVAVSNRWVYGKLKQKASRANRETLKRVSEDVAELAQSVDEKVFYTDAELDALIEGACVQITTIFD